MTHTITIEAPNARDLEPIRSLAQRLGLQAKEKEKMLSIEEQEALLKRSFGSWEGPETGDELIAMIEGARMNNADEAEL